MNNINAADFKGLLKSACANLKNNAKKIDTLNVFPVPDGDTGTNMSMTFYNGYIEANKCISDSISDIAKAFSRGLLMGARGNSGVITSQIFRGFYQYIEGKEEIDVNDVSAAFENGSRVAYKAIMKPVEGTILTVARESSWYANHDYENEHFELDEYFRRLNKYADESLQRTPDYLPILKEVGVVDSGGTGLLKIIEGMMLYLEGKPVEFNEDDAIDDEVNPALLLENEEFGYCTEFIFRLDKNIIDSFDEKILKKKLTDMGGESLVVVKDDDLVKVHVHTLKPGDALNIAQRYGEFVKLKIENMQEQHSSIINNADKVTERVNKPRKRYGIIAVAIGDGITNLFKDLGCDIVIAGGQTMNPSTQDFSKAIDELDNCDSIFILPNNSNIIMAANQAKNISEDNNIYVIETKSIQAGMSCLTYFDFDSDVLDNVEALNAAKDNVISASITYAIKDTTFDSVEVKQGDYIGIVNKDIVSSNKDIKDVINTVLDNLINNDKELLTVITGEDSKQDLTEYIEEYVNTNSSIEVNVIEGNQPVYSYLFGLE